MRSPARRGYQARDGLEILHETEPQHQTQSGGQGEFDMLPGHGHILYITEGPWFDFDGS